MTPPETLKQRRKQTILKELSEPISTEGIFIAVAAICASRQDTYEKRQAIFKESHERMLSAWFNDTVDELLDHIEESPSVTVAASRKQRRSGKEDDIQRIISIAKQMGL
jgi:hypothetical protein